MGEMLPPLGDHAHGELQAKFFRGLADAGRLRLLMQLRHGQQAAGDLARLCGLSPSNASNHLQCLLECGLVEFKACGRQNLYRLADPAIGIVLDATERLLGTRAGELIDACRNYGPPSRRAQRAGQPNALGVR